ncbi:MAG: nucleoside triphosphate pyrophosphohydrolase [Anaerolineae bacterium]|nr:nucleoside triphosphate pyrophosphohydrolase [Anaerolineae bacterium]
MSLHSLWSRAALALEALDFAGADGLQVFSAEALAALHHPPLNPDIAALIVAESVPDLAALRRVLGNQYPDAHPLQVVRAGAAVEAVPLAALPDVAGEWLALGVPPLPRPGSFERFQEVIAHLRAPEGCPWDRKQTHRSLRPYLLEETYEVLDALDAGDTDALREELGDLLLQIVLHSQVAVDGGEFRMSDVLAHIIEKIIRRHPHVWGGVDVSDDQEVKVNWDRLKQAEKAENGASASRLDGVAKALPALTQAYSYQDRAARVKFDWDTIAPVIAKVHEEIEELSAAQTAAEREAEAGDLLFAVVNWARWLGVDPESALRATNARFYRRFTFIEQQAAVQNRPVDDLSFEEMDALWEAAKDNGL